MCNMTSKVLRRAGPHLYVHYRTVDALEWLAARTGCPLCQILIRALYQCSSADVFANVNKRDLRTSPVYIYPRLNGDSDQDDAPTLRVSAGPKGCSLVQVKLPGEAVPGRVEASCVGDDLLTASGR